MAVLAFRDQLGYNFEFEDKKVLIQNGLSKYLVYCNPANPWAWKRKKQKGVDKVFKIGKHTFYVEESYCHHYYIYRTAWFQKCRLARFQGYPTDKYHHYIIVTNKPENFQAVFCLANNYSITIIDIDGLIALLGSYLTNLSDNIDNNNNVYATKDDSQVSRELVNMADGFCSYFRRLEDCAKHGVPWAIEEMKRFNVSA